jgi:hypothetical protein
MKIKELEYKLQKPLKKNIKVLGLDTASRTGWCLLTLGRTKAKLDYGFIDIKMKDKYLRYNEIIDTFNEIIKEGYKVIVENTFFRFNPKMFCYISRIGAIAYTLSYLKGCSPEYELATSARKKLGFKGNLKKKIFHEQFLERLQLDLEDEDIIDALVLSIVGGLKDGS